ncbi:MFS transporter, partial [Acinetobacter baumannii]|nr:MFS transporter [Acinetobacter baumannii]
EAPAGAPTVVRIGDKEIAVPTATKLTEHKFDEASTKAIAAFKKDLGEALKAAGYPAKADLTKTNVPLVIAILFVLVLYVTMVYG